MSITAQAIDLLHRHPGRKRIPTRRSEAERDHRPVEPSHVIQAAGVAIRIKFAGATQENALDALHGTTIGQLRLRGQMGDPSGISVTQHGAAHNYRGRVLAYHRLMGIPSPHPRALDLLYGSRGQSCLPESDTAVIDEIKGEFRNCRRVLLDCGAAIGLGSRINAIVYAVVIEDMNIGGLRSDDFGNLRNGLNALARYFK
jgi:hypothetical protein